MVRKEVEEVQNIPIESNPIVNHFHATSFLLFWLTLEVGGGCYQYWIFINELLLLIIIILASYLSYTPLISGQQILN